MMVESSDERGLLTKASPFGSVSETLERLRQALRAKGLEEFVPIDHSGAAKAVGLAMQEAKLLIFGSPRAGTPLMVTSPLLALDLPLKALVWRGPEGGVLVSYNATSYLAHRHGIPEYLGRTFRKDPARSKGGPLMAGLVEGIFLAPEAGAEMKSVQAAKVLVGCGLEGDRYCARTGHWSRFGRVCEVTLIAAEDLDDIERETGVGVKNGEHRRNVIIRGVSLKVLRRGERFRVGEVVFEYRGPRSVCRYIERLTEPGMTVALKGRGGVCAKVVDKGTVQVGDKIEVL